VKYALTTSSLHVNFGKTAVLWDISIKIPSGLIVVVLGPNGAGKSTLFKTALGLVSPFSGTIEVLGGSFKSFRNKIAYVPQRESIDWDFPITAEEVVLMGRYGRLGLFGRIRKADREAALHALELVGMLPYRSRQISQLSGGQQQRLFIARALVQEADLFLLDEPFAGVDATTEKTIMELFKTLKRQGKTILIIHHDWSTVEQYFDWLVLLNIRLVASGHVAEVFRPENLVQIFGKWHTLFDEATASLIKSRTGVV